MMADSNNKTMAVKEEVEHSSSFTDDAPRGHHVVIKTDTYAVDEAALGEHLPKHYYRSIGFIGTVTVSRLYQEISQKLTFAGFMSWKYQQLFGLGLAGQLTRFDRCLNWSIAKSVMGCFGVHPWSINRLPYCRASL